VLRPYYWIGHDKIGMLGAGPSWYRDRRWGVEIGFLFNPKAEPGEIRWRFYRAWFVPVVRFITAPLRSVSPTGGEWLSRRWTGRDHRIIGFQLGGRCWVWN